MSVKRAAPDDYALPGNPLPGDNSKFSDPRRAAEVRWANLVFYIYFLYSGNIFFLGRWHFFILASQKNSIDAGFRITTLVFSTPVERMMTVTEAQRNGYGIANTPSRLVLRSPTTAPETYTQSVSWVHYIFKQAWFHISLPQTGSAQITCSLLDDLLLTTSSPAIFRSHNVIKLPF